MNWEKLIDTRVGRTITGIIFILWCITHPKQAEEFYKDDPMLGDLY